MNPSDLSALARRNAEEAYQRRRRTARQTLRLAMLRLAGLSRPAPPEGAQASAPIERVAVVRPDHLGDLLFATPALHALRQALPGAHISALVGPWGAPVLAGGADVDELVELPFPGFARAAEPQDVLQPYRLLMEWAEKLRGRFDAALILRFDHWWGAWLAQAAGIPVRIGYVLPDMLPFLTDPVPYEGGRHEVVQNLVLSNELIRRAGGTALPLPARYAPEFALRFPAPGLLPSAARTLIAIHPGAGAAVKRWLAEAWAEVAEALAAETGARIVFTGSESERAVCGEVAARCAFPTDNLAGTTSLAGLFELYTRCRLVLGADSGPLHVAVAAGAPTVHLYGPADPLTFGPWGPRERQRVVTLGIGCAPCGVLAWDDELDLHPCVRAIAVQPVLAAARSALGAADVVA